MIDDAAIPGREGLKPAMEVIALENAVADETIKLLSRAYGLDSENPRPLDPQFIADPRTNSILVKAQSSRIAGIKDLIEALDR